MRKTMILLAAILFMGGCTTFGTFSNLKQGKNTQEDVRAMLGEPAATRFENNKEVWQYKFLKTQGTGNSRMRTVLNMDVIFKDKKVDNYLITVSKEAMPSAPGQGLQPRQPMGPGQRPQQRPQGGSGGNFMNQLDRDGDGRVSKNEFPGPDHIFKRLDRDGSGYIEAGEAPKGRPQQRGQGQMGPKKGRW